MIKLQMRGWKELAKAMRELGNDRTLKRGLRKSMLEAAEPIAKDARRRMKNRKSGKTAARIEASTTLSKRQRRGRRSAIQKAKAFGVEVFVGPGPRGPGVLNEFGSVLRRTKKGKSTGIMPANPFMRPAWEAGKMQALETFSKKLWGYVEKAAERARRKQARAAGKAKR